MSVVIDPNLVVSRYICPIGNPARILSLWEHDAIELVVAEPILAEYQRALGYEPIRARHRMTDEEIAGAVSRFRTFALLVYPAEAVDVIEDDPSDNKFLECAGAGGADYIISSDRHLLDLGEYRGIPILSPAAFLAVLGQQRR